MNNFNKNLFTNLIQNIIYYNCNKLIIDYRYGNTAYIDFIKPTEVQENVMKGKDDFERPFIVFKSEIIYKNPKFNKKTFTTFFQRYSDDSLLWHTCGNEGPILFDTCGGINITQLKLLDDLLKNGYVDLTPDMDYENLKLILNIKVQTTPIKIKLGHSV